MANGGRSESGAPAEGRALSDVFSTDEIFQRITAVADEEAERPSRLLFFSGVSAGLSIGLSFVARISLTGLVGEGFASNLLYPVGFILVVIGRYQLFTEETLTPLTLVLTRLASLPNLLRLWGVALLGNLIGAATVAFLTSIPEVMTTEAMAAARGIAGHALEIHTLPLFLKAQGAGFVVASMVWLIHAARSITARVLIVYFLMLLIPVAEFYHCIIGACEVLFLVFDGGASLLEAARFFGTVLLGNTVGGVVLVALLNYGQTHDPRYAEEALGRRLLPWREFFFGRARGE